MRAASLQPGFSLALSYLSVDDAPERGERQWPLTAKKNRGIPETRGFFYGLPLWGRYIR